MAMELLPEGTRLRDRYHVEQCVERNEHAVLYRVRDEKFSANWAMWVYDAAATAPERRQAFERDAARFSQLRHQGLAHVVDHFFEGDVAYVVSEWVDGKTLRDRLKAEGGRLPLEQVADLGTKLLDVIYFLHTGYDPIVLKILTPRSVWVTDDDEIKLYDYGVGRIFDPDAADLPYVAPECRNGQKADLAADIYAAGALLVLAASGQAPADGVRPDNNLPPALSRVLTKAVASDPADRHVDAGELKHDLMAVAEGFAPDDSPGAGAVASTDTPSVASAAANGTGQVVGSRRSGGCVGVLLLWAIAVLGMVAAFAR